MNYLAHFFLAGSNDGLIVGNLLADFVKGNKYLELPESVQKGVELHRSIDEYTDTHVEVEKTKVRLRKKYRKYSPVISDVFYDYVLGTNWSNYSPIPLKEFSQGIYRTLEKHQDSYPLQAKMTIGYMAKNDWLYHYSTFFGIEMALKGLSRRAKFETNMQEAVEDLRRDYKLIEQEFKPFFNDLMDHVQKEIKKY